MGLIMIYVPLCININYGVMGLILICVPLCVNIPRKIVDIKGQYISLLLADCFAGFVILDVKAKVKYSS
jgi:hypothetical protein